MSIQAISVGIAKTVGQIVPTNQVKFREKQNGMDVANELLVTRMPGGVVVNEKNQLVGFISEFDLLGALEAGKDLRKIDGRRNHGEEPHQYYCFRLYSRGYLSHESESIAELASRIQWQSGLYHHEA